VPHAYEPKLLRRLRLEGSHSRKACPGKEFVKVHL
jgi:hypothetical protein